MLKSYVLIFFMFAVGCAQQPAQPVQSQRATVSSGDASADSVDDYHAVVVIPSRPKKTEMVNAKTLTQELGLYGAPAQAQPVPGQQPQGQLPQQAVPRAAQGQAAPQQPLPQGAPVPVAQQSTVVPYDGGTAPVAGAQYPGMLHGAPQKKSETKITNKKVLDVSVFCLSAGEESSYSSSDDDEESFEGSSSSKKPKFQWTVKFITQEHGLVDFGKVGEKCEEAAITINKRSSKLKKVKVVLGFRVNDKKVQELDHSYGFMAFPIEEDEIIEVATKKVDHAANKVSAQPQQMQYPYGIPQQNFPPQQGVPVQPGVPQPQGIPAPQGVQAQ